MEELLTTGAVTDMAIGMTITNTAAAIISSLIFGLAIALTYMKTHKDSSYSQSLTVTLTILPIILSMIILFVGSNVARAFSLAGTLTIIRFRSAPGEPKDIGFIFFDIAAGLACGIGQYLYGAVFVAVVCIFMLIISFVDFGKPKSTVKTLKILIPEDLDYEKVFDGILKKYTASFTLKKIKTTDLGSLFELEYVVKMPDNKHDKELIDELRCRNGNLSITLSMASSEPYMIK